VQSPVFVVKQAWLTE